MKIKINNKTVLIDKEDYPLVSRFKWYIKKNKNMTYVETNVSFSGVQFKLSMQRLILGISGYSTDHANGNGLDNRKANLRICNSNQSAWNRRSAPNSHGYKGIFLNKEINKYYAKIQANGKRFTLGPFKTAKAAAIGYDKLSKEHHGTYGVRNF